jgi:hypothetical protein
MEDDEPEKNSDGVVKLGLILEDPETASENVSKNKDIKAQHQEGIEHGPNDPQIASPVSYFDLALCELPEEAAVGPE